MTITTEYSSSEFMGTGHITTIESTNINSAEAVLARRRAALEAVAFEVTRSHVILGME